MPFDPEPEFAVDVDGGIWSVLGAIIADISEGSSLSFLCDGSKCLGLQRLVLLCL